jgi:tetratricopeptide (TPR) repeat protein
LSKYGIAAAGLLVLGVLGFFLWQHAQAKPLTDRDVLVLADFTNKTGDAEFDGALRQALAFELEQSPFLKIMDDEEVNQTLQLMGRAPGERITNDIAREVCVRERQKATIGGSIASLGKTYAIALQAVNCQTGATLAREQAEAEDKEHVLEAVAKAATAMRAKLGESLSSIEKLNRPSDVTTPSLEAFKAYVLGSDLQSQGRSREAIPHLQRAIELDPNFAEAYELLSREYLYTGDRARSNESLTKAFDLIGHASERERLFISATYYERITREIDKAIDAYQVLARIDPRNSRPHNRMFFIYSDTGRYQEALREELEAVRVNPNNLLLIGNLMSAYMNLDRFDESKAVAESAFERKLDGSTLRLNLLRLAYIQGDHAAQEKEIKWLAGKPEEGSSLRLQSFNALVLGRRRNAIEFLRAGAGGLPVAALAYIDAVVGDCEAARKEQSSPALVICGDPAAMKAADEQDAKNPLLNPDAAERLYRQGEFQKILDHKGRNWGPYYSLAYLGLARASAHAGDIAKAKHAYQDFLALWKDADKDAPFLKQATEELADLH